MIHFQSTIKAKNWEALEMALEAILKQVQERTDHDKGVSLICGYDFIFEVSDDDSNDSSNDSDSNRTSVI